MYNNVNRVLIGDGTNSAATSLQTMVAGDLFLLNEAGTVITTEAAAALLPKYSKVSIAAGIGAGIVILSSPIQGSTVSKYAGHAYVAPLEQVTYVGYNGTSGTGIAAVVDTEYRLRILIKDTLRVQGERSTLIDINAPASPVQTVANVAYTIAKLFDQKDYNTNYQTGKVKLERTSNGTGTVLGGSATTAAVFGSDIITLSSASHGLVVGSIIRLGGTTYATGSTYVVTALPTSTTAKLDVVYKGATATITNANSLTLAGVSEYGFRITGLSQTSKVSQAANAPLDEYEWIVFDASYAPANIRLAVNYATVTTTQKANPGEGYWKQVADREEAAKGYWGDTSKRRFYDQRIASLVVINQAYISVIITHHDVHGGNFQENTTSPLKTEIYIPDGSAQATNTPTSNNFLAILNAYFSTVLGFPAI